MGAIGRHPYEERTEAIAFKSSLTRREDREQEEKEAGHPGGCCGPRRRKQDKGAWGMPWLPEMTKDVVSCEKLRGGANDR